MIVSKLCSTDPNALQQSINNMDNWLSSHQLFLAPQKCAILKIKKNSVLDDHHFHIKNHCLDEVPSIKDLGVVVSNDLKWASHVNRITNLASVTSYQLFKSMKSKNIWTWMKLFNSYIRPKLEFNTPVWSPYLIGDIDKVEHIQRKFTKIAFRRCNFPTTTYEDRLEKLGQLSLERRRIFFDLILLYKILNNLSELNFDDYFILVSSGYNLRSHSYQIDCKAKHDSLQWHNSFFARIPSLWNKLPSHIVDSPSLSIFKCQLKVHLLQNP